MTLSRYDAHQPRRMSRRILRGFTPASFTAVRKRAGMSVSDLARISGVAVSTIHNWEAGKRSPQIDILAAAMNTLGADIDTVVLIPPDERYPGDWRVMKGLTQPQLAAAAHLPTVTVQRIERADKTLTDANAATLAALLGVTVDTYRQAYERARTRPAGTPS